MARELEQVQRAVNICFCIELGLRERWPYACTSSEVNYAIEVSLVENSFERGSITNVYFVNAVTWIFEVLGNVFMFERGVVEIVKIVDDGDARNVGCKQAINEMRPDKAGAARDEKVFHPYFVA